MKLIVYQNKYKDNERRKEIKVRKNKTYNSTNQQSKQSMFYKD